MDKNESVIQQNGPNPKDQPLPPQKKEEGGGIPWWGDKPLAIPRATNWELWLEDLFPACDPKLNKPSRTAWCVGGSVQFSEVSLFHLPTTSGLGSK